MISCCGIRVCVDYNLTIFGVLVLSQWQSKFRLARFCEPLACASRDPLWTPAFDVFPDDPDAFHGKFECTGPNVYGQQCLMICDDGYAVPATEVRIVCACAL